MLSKSHKHPYCSNNYNKKILVAVFWLLFKNCNSFICALRCLFSFIGHDTRMIQKSRIMTIVLLRLVINKPPPWCRLCPSDLTGTVFSMDVCPRKANMRNENKPISPPSILQAWKTGEIIDFSKIYISSGTNLQLCLGVNVIYLNIQILWFVIWTVKHWSKYKLST